MLENKLIFVCLYFLCRSIIAEGQYLEDAVLESSLCASGFENLSIKRDKHVIHIQYENLTFRCESAAMLSVIDIAQPYYGDLASLRLIPACAGVPILSLQVDPPGVHANRIETYENENATVVQFIYQPEFRFRREDNLEYSNSSTWKSDIILQPQLYTRFGDRGNPVRSQINLAPTLSTNAGSGFLLTYQWILPVQNDLDNSGDHSRPGIISINHLANVYGWFFLNSAIGYFTQNRYGMDIRAIRIARDGRYAISGRAGYTGYASYEKGTWYYSRPYIWTWEAKLQGKYHPLDVVASLTVGEFLYRDFGIRFDVMRNFRETTIGFFFCSSGIGECGGFNFTIPLPPKKRPSRRRIRLITPGSFSQEYRSEDNKTCTRYDTGSEFEDILNRHSSAYFQNTVIGRIHEDSISK